MKQIPLILLMVFLVLSGMAQSGSNSKYLKPTNFQKKVTTLISKKSRSYYSLDTEKPSLITIQGPGIVRVMSRGRFVPKEEDEIDYEVFYRIDGGEEEIVKLDNVRRSKDATYLNGELGVPGQLYDFEITLGRGYHNIELIRSESSVPIACRYKFTPTKEKKREWIAFCPMRPSEPVDLISRESTVSYYRFSMEKPLKIDIIGPTELRIMTRVENHYQMRGRIDYRIQVKENGNIINTYQLSSRHSQVAVYKDDKNLIPGKACEFVINVPKGKHIYEVLPLDKDKSTVLGRVLLPEKDVSLEH